MKQLQVQVIAKTEKKQVSWFRDRMYRSMVEDANVGLTLCITIIHHFFLLKLHLKIHLRSLFTFSPQDQVYGPYGSWKLRNILKYSAIDIKSQLVVKYPKWVQKPIHPKGEGISGLWNAGSGWRIWGTFLLILEPCSWRSSEDEPAHQTTPSWVSCPGKKR